MCKDSWNNPKDGVSIGRVQWMRPQLKLREGFSKVWREVGIDRGGNPILWTLSQAWSH